MSGYIGTTPSPQSTQTRNSFTATSGQTSFATSGYAPGFLDVYLNGVHLEAGTDYTAANGSDIVLTVGATVDDLLEVVAFDAFKVAVGGASGGGLDRVFIENDQNVTTSYSIPNGKNALSIGPINIASGATVNVPTGSRYLVL